MSIEEIKKGLDSIRAEYEEVSLLSEVNVIDAAIGLIEKSQDELAQMRNELCIKCGNYKNAHLGACNGCRWKKEE